MKYFLALVLSFTLVVPGFQSSYAATPKTPVKKELKKEVKKQEVKKDVKKQEVKKPEPKKESPKKEAPKRETSLPVAAQAVTIKDFKFVPAELTVKKGTVITWANEDSVRHNAHSQKKGGPEGPLLAKGEKYNFTANTIGTFDYVCDPHAGFMQGKLTVTP